MLRILFLFFFLYSCSPKIIYTQDGIRKNSGIARQRKISKITKHNQKQMNKVRKKVSDKRSKNNRKHRKYS